MDASKTKRKRFQNLECHQKWCYYSLEWDIYKTAKFEISGPNGL